MGLFRLSGLLHCSLRSGCSGHQCCGLGPLDLKTVRRVAIKDTIYLYLSTYIYRERERVLKGSTISNCLGKVSEI